MMNLNIRLVLTLFAVFVLTIVPIPTVIAGLRPSWLLLLVLYIQFFLPSYFNIALLLFMGFCLDVLLSTVLGEHAFALLLTSWLATSRARRFVFFSMIQQMVLIALFCLIYQLIIYLIDSFLGYHNKPLMMLGAALFSTLFWPWLRWALGQSRVSIKNRQTVMSARANRANLSNNIARQIK